MTKTPIFLKEKEMASSSLEVDDVLFAGDVDEGVIANETKLSETNPSNLYSITKK